MITNEVSMKYFKLFIIAFLLPFSASANTDDEIKALVYKWNDLLKTKNRLDLVDFLDLYAPKVLFYSKDYTDEDCYSVKEKFHKSGFTQYIISPINITYYNSGAVKAEFTKSTIIGKKRKEQFSYLVFKQFDGKYRITGESDYSTDQKKNIILSLGEPVKPQDDNDLNKGNDNGKLFLFLLLTGIALFSLGYFVTKRRNNVSSYRKHEPPNLDRLEFPFNRKEINTRKELYNAVNTIPESITKQKGDNFEKYIVERFNHPCFKLIEWRSDKIHNGVYAASSMHPDLEYHFKTSNADCYFAVECKWRSSFFEGRIQWAKEHQLENYRNFSAEKQIEVFVLIGIGGQPNQPRALYIVPFRDITSIYLYENELQPYYRISRSTFYFDADTLKLS